MDWTQVLVTLLATLPATLASAAAVIHALRTREFVSQATATMAAGVANAHGRIDVLTKAISWGVRGEPVGQPTTPYTGGD